VRRSNHFLLVPVLLAWLDKYGLLQVATGSEIGVDVWVAGVLIGGYGDRQPVVRGFRFDRLVRGYTDLSAAWTWISSLRPACPRARCKRVLEGAQRSETISWHT
jgi:hypothetical protein